MALTTTIDDKGEILVTRHNDSGTIDGFTTRIGKEGSYSLLCEYSEDQNGLGINDGTISVIGIKR